MNPFEQLQPTGDATTDAVLLDNAIRKTSLNKEPMIYASAQDLPRPNAAEEVVPREDSLPAVKKGFKNYGNTVKVVAKAHKMDPYLIMAVMQQESSFNPDASSGVGAQGLMQVMPQTSKDLGVPMDSLKDPKSNIEAGTRYLKKQMKRYDGDIFLALAAYNWGLGNVNKLVAEFPNEPWSVIQDYVPDETRDYVHKIVSNYKELIK